MYIGTTTALCIGAFDVLKCIGGSCLKVLETHRGARDFLHVRELEKVVCREVSLLDSTLVSHD